MIQKSRNFYRLADSKKRVFFQIFDSRSEDAIGEIFRTTGTSQNQPRPEICFIFIKFANYILLIKRSAGSVVVKVKKRKTAGKEFGR